MPLKEMEPIARDATRNALQGKNIPETDWEKVTLGQGFEGDFGVFELYVPGKTPGDARIISRATVHRITGEVKVEVYISSPIN